MPKSPLLVRVRGDHSIREFTSAARLRYSAAVFAAGSDDRLMAVYLAGYSCEMLLKAAHFRLQGKGLDDVIAVNDIKDVPSQAPKLFGTAWRPPPGRGSRLHDIVWWAYLLDLERSSAGVPYAPAFSIELTNHVHRVYGHWQETLRYRVNRPYAFEVAAVLTSTNWFLVNWPSL